jgi:hypothetical protein
MQTSNSSTSAPAPLTGPKIAGDPSQLSDLSSNPADITGGDVKFQEFIIQPTPTLFHEFVINDPLSSGSLPKIVISGLCLSYSSGTGVASVPHADRVSINPREITARIQQRFNLRAVISSAEVVPVSPDTTEAIDSVPSPPTATRSNGNSRRGSRGNNRRGSQKASTPTTAGTLSVAPTAGTPAVAPAAVAGAGAFPAEVVLSLIPPLMATQQSEVNTLMQLAQVPGWNVAPQIINQCHYYNTVYNNFELGDVLKELLNNRYVLNFRLFVQRTGVIRVTLESLTRSASRTSDRERDSSGGNSGRDRGDREDRGGGGGGNNSLSPRSPRSAPQQRRRATSGGASGGSGNGGSSTTPVTGRDLIPGLSVRHLSAITREEYRENTRLYVNERSYLTTELVNHATQQAAITCPYYAIEATLSAYDYTIFRLSAWDAKTVVVRIYSATK